MMIGHLQLFAHSSLQHFRPYALLVFLSLGWLSLCAGGLQPISVAQEPEPQENSIGSVVFGTSANGRDPFATPIPSQNNNSETQRASFQQPPSQQYPTTPTPTDPSRMADLRFDRGAPNPSLDASIPLQDFRQGRVLAIVGQERILEGDIAPMVDPELYKNRDKIPKHQWEATREQIMHIALKKHIMDKCLAQKFIRDQVGSKPIKEQRELMKRILPKLHEGFYTEQIPHLMKNYEVESELELDQKLREIGTSIAAQQRLFQDGVLSQQAIRQNVPDKPKIYKQDLEEYYDSHPDQWARPARARWVEMNVLFKNHPTKEKARQKIEEMGNEVFLGGAKMEAVAKKRSEGWSASEAGLHDWTTKGALRSTVIDEAIFSIPVNRLSQILEDEDGYHIVMVLEREEARSETFANAQAAIREQLTEDLRNKGIQEFIEKARSESMIWSLWPDDVPGARPLHEVIPD